MKKYKAISVSYSNIGETSHFIAEERVTEEEVRAGNDEGVVCQVLDLSLIGTMLSALNGHHGHDTDSQKENP
ncbi:hypothetical protein [Shinella sp. JR1-6]|uniref:hypothetical protein n=1 Tax=Shinella sp. JR1-6 TaxID=2527671 RepID=UPI00102D3D78|nr:hypothetical protein [Shinella sp. JR1-6]TAA54562.1 hypothetical protein EXZ48_26410 [Shinella sp. JR1-6]